MDDMTPADAPSQDRLLVILAYGLFLISVAGGVPLLVGAIIAFVRKPHARGTIYESHYCNLILVFVVMLVFAGMMIATGLVGVMALLFGAFGQAGMLAWQFPASLMLVPVAALISLVLGLWFLWRVIGGMVRALDEKSY